MQPRVGDSETGRELGQELGIKKEIVVPVDVGHWFGLLLDTGTSPRDPFLFGKVGPPGEGDARQIQL